MKIALIATTSYPCPPITYGGEVFWWDLCCMFSEMGHHVTLFAGPGSLCPPNGTLRYLPGFYAQHSIRAVEAVVTRKRAMKEILEMDMIIDASHEKMVMQEICYFHREHKQRTIGILNGLVTHTPACPPWNLVVGSVKWKELSLLGLSQFYLTPWAKQYGSTMTPLPASAIVAVIPWAINTEFYHPAHYEKDDYFLWFSRPTPYKGLHRAINLAKEMGFRLVVAMPMEIKEHQEHGEIYMKQIEEAVSEGARIEVARLPGDSRHHVAKRALYRRAKALLFTTEAHEPFGLTVIESLACGTPVIASRMGAMPEIIEHGHTGFLSHIDNDDGFKMAIESIDQIDPVNCKRVAVEKFDRRLAAERYLQLHDDLRKVSS